MITVLIFSFILTGCWEFSAIKNTPVEQTAIDLATTNVEPQSNIDFELVSMKPNQSVVINMAANHILTNSQTHHDKKPDDVLALIKKRFELPIKYNTQTWDNYNSLDKNNNEKELNQKSATTTVSLLNVNRLGKTPEKFGEVISIDERSLDFAGHPATKYRYMPDNAPYFNLVDSVDYLQVNWYYAHSDDTKNEKLMSIEHAKKAYLMSHQIMSDEGGQLVMRILDGEVIKNRKINDVEVVIGKCRLYDCMIVVKKSIFAEIDAEYAAMEALQKN